jgi:cytochrome c oxidase subunit 2
MNWQSALNPAGDGARTIATLLWIFTGLLGAIFVIVVSIALGSLFRRHRGIEQEPLEQTHLPSPQTERRLRRVVGSAIVLTTVIIIGLITISISAAKAVSGRIVPEHALVIEVTGTQWWWSIRYMNDHAALALVTANEIHIPVGRPVLIRGTSQDVIHSFWIPNLQGKRDLIPSRVTTEWFEAKTAGRYRGQCAEFCGLQHAHMALWVVAEPEEAFERWMKAQLEPAPDPVTPTERQGQQVFLGNACILCHTIRGTPAQGQVAPDLTHIASRLTIAAGTLPNNRGNLAGWIADPQSIKPGNHMATVPLPAGDMQPLLDYLESLK